MTKQKPEWKIETIKELRQEKTRQKIISYIEIMYNTILPILFTYYFFETRSFFFLILILFIIFIRIRRE